MNTIIINRFPRLQQPREPRVQHPDSKERKGLNTFHTLTANKKVKFFCIFCKNEMEVNIIVEDCQWDDINGFVVLKYRYADCYSEVKRLEFTLEQLADEIHFKNFVNNKFYIGDKVLIKEKFIKNGCNTFIFSTDDFIKKYKGTKITISQITDQGFYKAADIDYFLFADSMLTKIDRDFVNYKKKKIEHKRLNSTIIQKIEYKMKNFIYKI